MASDYGLNFGFRRSDETLRLSEGRNRTKAGTDGVLLIGTAVEVDYAAGDDTLKQADADVALAPGTSGLVLQELVHERSIYETDASALDSFDINKTRPNRMTVMTSGAGTKVWFKNTAQDTRVDGREIDAVDIVDLTGVAPGDELGWDGTQWAKVNGTTVNNGWFVVTELLGSDGCEAVLQA